MSECKNAYFASGCFWCITPAFQEKNGVRKVTSGYCGGEEENPSYLDVKSQKTGHRETVMVTYNPEKISYRELMDIFLANVDPYDGGGQFIDRGFSYTLAVYYETESERQTALACIQAMEAASGKNAQIALAPFNRFWPAEEYHQDYYRKHPAEFQQELIESGRIRLN